MRRNIFICVYERERQKGEGGESEREHVEIRGHLQELVLSFYHVSPGD